MTAVPMLAVTIMPARTIASVVLVTLILLMLSESQL